MSGLTFPVTNSDVPKGELANPFVYPFD